MTLPGDLAVKVLPSKQVLHGNVLSQVVPNILIMQANFGLAIATQMCQPAIL